MQASELGWRNSKFGGGIQKPHAVSIPCFLKRDTLAGGSRGGSRPKISKNWYFLVVFPSFFSFNFLVLSFLSYACIIFSAELWVKPILWGLGGGLNNSLEGVF